MTFRVAIAGCGRVAGAPDDDGKVLATNHANAARACPGVELVAACDTIPDRARRFGERWGVAAYDGDVVRMCKDARVDLLIVATPPKTQERVCLLALEARVRGLLCEKPFTGTRDGASRVLVAAGRARVPVVVNFMRRWDSSHQVAASRIARGDIGVVRAVQVAYTGTIRGNGAHALDVLGMMVDKSLGSRWDILARKNAMPSSPDPPLSFTLSRDGCVAHMDAILDADYFVYEAQIYGTKGRVRLLRSGNDIRFDWPVSSDAYPGYRYLDREECLPQDTLPQSFVRALSGLCEAVTSNDFSSGLAHEHLETLTLIDELTMPETNHA